MPIFAPRNEPIKKKEELQLKKQVLENAILNNLGIDSIIKKAEKYKTTRILYSKAILHVIKDRESQERKHSFDKEKALKDIEIWEGKTIETIIDEIRSELKLNQ